MEALLAIQGVDITRQLRSGDTPFRLRIDALRLGPGERLGIVGPSGSGKSTLLDFAALLTWPNKLDSFVLRDPDNTELDLASVIRQRQSDTLSDARARCIGYVVQNGALLPYLSVAANAMLAARLADQPVSVSRERLARYSKRLGIHDLLDRLPARLSGGERQRAAVVRMLMTGARVLIADEPTAALDEDTGKELMTLFMETAEEAGAGILCASHDQRMLDDLDFRLLQVQKRVSDDGKEYIGTLTELHHA